MHPHRDMEIITYVLSGELEHKDSTGGVGVLKANDIQKMTAGTGIYHSEINPSPTETAHLLQIWITPHETGVAPSYTDRHIPASEKSGVLKLLVSPDGRGGSLSMLQDAYLYASLPKDGQKLTHDLAIDRKAYVQVVKGSIVVNGTALATGDAAMLEDEAAIVLSEGAGAEVLVFDLPG